MSTLLPVEGHVLVPGGELHYRLAGPDTAPHVLVFENGWGGSFPYAWWLEQALAPHVRVLFYDRAGVASSRSTAPISTEGLTRQLEALLSSLGLSQPVVLVGHSYGGLIGALHAAQAPALVKAIVQIDPTPEFDDELIDGTLRNVPRLARFLQLCTLLRIDNPLMSLLSRDLPPDVVLRLKSTTRQTLRSLQRSIAEIRLLWDMRRRIAASGSARECPRLVISAAPLPEPRGRLQKLLANEAKEERFRLAAMNLHQRHAAQNKTSRWTTLPYNHVSLVTDQAGATAVAAKLLDFIG